ncbi:MAG: DUF2207 family protein [Clostridia bacterium]
MKKTNYLLKALIMMAIFIAIILITNQVQAGSIKLNNLDFEIQLNEDGSMDVTENWNAKITNTNTMFKDFELDSSKFKEITNVEVYRVNNDGTKQKLTKINQEMYHVTKDCYYGLKVNSGDFEIAWGVSVNGTETRKYQVKYTVVDAIKTYNDCSELYWQLVGKENTIPVNKLTATIKLPKAVENKNNVRGWAHGPYNGNITIYKDKVYLEVDYLDSEVMVEARVVTLENLFSTNKVTNINKFNSILSQEQAWADEANAEREEYIREKERQENAEKIFNIVIKIMTIVLGIFFAYKLIKNILKASKTEKKKMPEIDYFRDIPDEQASAGDAAFLYYFKKERFSKNISKVLSATILQLALKKYISFSIDNTESKPQVRINVLDYSDHINQMPSLKRDEQTVYNLLVKVANSTKNDTRTFNMKEFEKYAKKHSEVFINQINTIESTIKIQQEESENYSKEIEKQTTSHAAYAIMYIVWGIIAMVILPIISILLLSNAITHFIMYNKIYNLTDKGLEEKAKWNGLKKYMEDFSLLNEKEVPDLVLWEKYLVFATAFGIADKVLEQLKIKYPELQQMDGYEYAYMNILYHSTLNTEFLNSLNTSVKKAYMGGMSAQASSGYSGGNFSSGGGYGGGFSDGGGFGGGGGRNGRKINQIKIKSSHSHMATF